MAKYTVEVIEELSRVVEQEAESYEDAVECVATRYIEEDIVLDWEDRINVEYRPYPSQELAEDFNLTINYDRSNRLLDFHDKHQSIATYDCKDLEEFNIAITNFFKGYIKLEEVKEQEKIIVPAKKLGYGDWFWHKYNDGSGYLESLSGKKYMSYDLATNEYEIYSGSGKYNFFPLSTYYADGVDPAEFEPFEYMEDEMLYYVLPREKEQENKSKEMEM